MRRPDEIAALFQILKEKVTESSALYIEKIAASQRDAISLNKVIAGLDFDA